MTMVRMASILGPRRSPQLFGSRPMITTSRRRARRQRGFTIYDGLIWLIGVSIGIGLLGGMFGKYTSQTRTNQAVQAVNTMASKLRSEYQTSGNFGAGSLFAVANSSNAIPSFFTVNVGAGTISHPWNGNVTVTANGATFDLAMDTLPSDACITLAGQDFSQVTTTINGTAVVPPVPLATAQADCGAGANTVGWTFQR